MKPVFKLDPYERELEDHLEEMVEIPTDDPIHKQLEEAAKNYRKDQAISLRVSLFTLSAIKSKAKKAGMPYQTLINTLLHQFATGQIEIKL